MIEFPFIGGAYAGRSLNLNAQVCQNLYPVADKEGGKSVLSLMGVPGSKLFCTSGIAGAVRGYIEWGDYLYKVVGATLYKVDSAGTPTNVGTLGTSTGIVYMAAGTTHLMIVDGTDGYYKTAAATSLTTITDVDFPANPTSVTYQDGYFIVTNNGSDSIWISGPEDASSWDGLDFASAEDTPDEALLVKSHNRELWIPGEDTTEIFYNSGSADFPFSRVSGGVLKIGCGAPGSFVSMLEGAMWLDNHFRVILCKGYTPEQVSTPAIEYAFQGYATKSDAIAFAYRQEGHTFYQITFPTESRTWVYDLTTGLWHTRVSGTGTGRHRANAFCYAFGKNLVGDWQNGNTYELDLATYTDVGGAYIVAKRACQAIHKGKQRIFHHALELDMETGVGLVTGHGSDPQVCLEWSDDGGHTWSNEHWVTMGAIGAYTTRARWSKMGSSRQRVYRVTIDDPVKRVIIGAYLDASEGAH